MRSRAVDHFIDDVELVIKRFRKEYEMSYAELVGSLEIIKADVIRELFSNTEEEEIDDEEA